MTEDELVDRISHLKKKQEEFIAEIHALGGAIKDCEFWLSRIKEKEAEPVKPHLVTET
jgi:hypothetical protein